MEKMQLGSPAGSPAQNTYLPSFLMENTQTNLFSTTSPTASPDFNRSNLQQRFLTNLQSPSQTYANTSIGQNSSIQQQSTVYQSKNNNTSISGPPINSLFDSLRNEMSFQTPTKSFYHQSQVIHQDTPQNVTGFNQSRVFSPIPYNNPNQMTPTAATNNNQSFNNASINGNFQSRFNNTNNQGSDFWVTVFGFPTEAISTILSHFSSCGTILEKVCSSGNWIHLRYSSRYECDKALLYNGKIIGDNLMIGVIRCHDESVLEKENSIESQRANISKIRSLTQVAYKSAKIDSEVVPVNDDPKKTTGIVNKAMDLLFGW